MSRWKNKRRRWKAGPLAAASFTSRFLRACAAGLNISYEEMTADYYGIVRGRMLDTYRQVVARIGDNPGVLVVHGDLEQRLKDAGITVEMKRASYIDPRRFEDDDDPIDPDEEAMLNCSMGPDGYCGQAGSEYCEFECPYGR